MSITQLVKTINEGLFNSERPPTSMTQVLENGSQRVEHWQYIRPAVEALSQMPWLRLDEQWDYFLDEERYPVGRYLDLRPDEVDPFQNLIHSLEQETREPMRILTSVQPEVSLTDVWVTVDATDLPTLGAAIGHVQRTAELAAINDAITISSLQSGSLDIVLTAGKASLYALQLAIVLAKILKAPVIGEKASALKRLWGSIRPDDTVTDEQVLEAVHGEASADFWKNVSESLDTVVKATGGSPPEAQSRVNQAAKEIYRHAEEVSADWKLPPAVITGLPGGMAVNLNFDNPELIGRVVRAIAAPVQESEDEN